MKKCIYSLSLLRADYKIYESKKNKKTTYFVEIEEEVCFCYGGEMKITIYPVDTFRRAIERLRMEVGIRVEKHVHIVTDSLPF